jgi:hypothetical protein
VYVLVYRSVAASPFHSVISFLFSVEGYVLHGDESHISTGLRTLIKEWKKLTNRMKEKK